MTEEQIISKMKTLDFSEEEIAQWQRLIPGLEPAEKDELGKLIEQIAAEQNILAARHAEEVRELMQTL